MLINGDTGDLHVASRQPFPYGAYSSIPLDTFGPRAVSPEGALSLAHVYGAVRLVASAVGTLPLETRDMMNGGVLVRAAQTARLLRYQPNSDMSAKVLWTLVATHLLLRGNAYLAKSFDNRGLVSELLPINPSRVFPFRDENGDKRFRVVSGSSVKFVERIFTPDQILHIIGHSIDDGLSGASPISLVRNRMGVQTAQSEAQGRLYAQGLSTRGALSVPPGVQLTKEMAAQLRREWEAANHGMDNTGRVAILHSGASFQNLTMSMQDAQFIESMRWGATEAATIFNIPASRINADSGASSVKYANVGQDDVHFYKQAVMPIASYIEDALNIDPALFGASSPWVPQFDAEAVLRADTKTRFEAYQIATGGMAWMDAEDVRVREGLSPKVMQQGVQQAQRSASDDEIEQRDAQIDDLQKRLADKQLRMPVPSIEVVVPPQEPPIVNVAPPEVTVEAPVVHVAPPDVRVEPVINVAAPQVSVDAPVVNVAPPDAPVVNVTVEQPAEDSAPKTVQFSRDSAGRITGAKVTE